MWKFIDMLDMVIFWIPDTKTSILEYFFLYIFWSQEHMYLLINWMKEPNFSKMIRKTTNFGKKGLENIPF